MERIRAGSFWPTPGVESLMEIAVGVSPAMIAATKARPLDPPDDHDARTRAARVARHKATTEHADVQSACDRLESLELELRGPDGSLIETEDIWLQDTEFLLSLANADVERELDKEFRPDEDDPSLEEPDEPDDLENEFLAELDSWSEGFDPEWGAERPFSRYQVFAKLVDDAAVP